MNGTDGHTDGAMTAEQQIALLRAQIESLARDNEKLAAENSRLAAEAAAESARIAELEGKMARIIEQIKLANMRFFGSKSEKVVPEQLSLFNGAEAAADPSAEEPAVADALSPARPRRRGGKRRIDTSKLERVVVEHAVEDPECPECGSALSEMKVGVTEVIRLVPAHLVVEEHRRHVYRCDSCCGSNAEGGEEKSVIVRAPMPALTPIPGSFATASLVASVINSKLLTSGNFDH